MSNQSFTDKQTTQSNNCNPFENIGLIFDSEEDYLLFKKIDRNINNIVKSVNDGNIFIEEVFNNVKPITVKESFKRASQNLFSIFDNVRELFCSEYTRNSINFKIVCSFFDKINIIKYFDSDSDNSDNSDSDNSDSDNSDRESYRESDREINIKIL